MDLQVSNRLTGCAACWTFSRDQHGLGPDEGLCASASEFCQIASFDTSASGPLVHYILQACKQSKQSIKVFTLMPTSVVTGTLARQVGNAVGPLSAKAREASTSLADYLCSHP